MVHGNVTCVCSWKSLRRGPAVWVSEAGVGSVEELTFLVTDPGGVWFLLSSPISLPGRVLEDVLSSDR